MLKINQQVQQYIRMLTDSFVILRLLFVRSQCTFRVDWNSISMSKVVAMTTVLELVCKGARLDVSLSCTVLISKYSYVFTETFFFLLRFCDDMYSRYFWSVFFFNILLVCVHVCLKVR